MGIRDPSAHAARSGAALFGWRSAQLFGLHGALRRPPVVAGLIACGLFRPDYETADAGHRALRANAYPDRNVGAPRDYDTGPLDDARHYESSDYQRYARD